MRVSSQSRRAAERVRIAGVALAVWLSIAASCQAAEYSVVDLGSVQFNAWMDINNQRQVLVNGSFAGAFIYQDGLTTTLSLPRDSFLMERFFDIGPAGDVSGGIDNSEPDGLGIYSTAAVFHADGGVSDLDTFDGISASAFGNNRSDKNVSGNEPFAYSVAQAVGGDLNVTSHAFLHDGTVFHDLGTLGGLYSLAYAINEAGQIVGLSTPAGPAEFVGSSTWASRAFLYANGTMQDLNSLAGDSTWTLESALAINDQGLIVGYGTTGGARRGFLYDDGTVVDMGVLSGFNNSMARDVNASGDVVGMMYSDSLKYFSMTTNGDELAFLHRDGTTYDLNSMIDPSSGWVLEAAHGINDQGQIVGYGLFNDGETQTRRAFLLTPVPEPSGIALGGLGLLGLLGWAIRPARFARR